MWSYGPRQRNRGNRHRARMSVRIGDISGRINLDVARGRYCLIQRLCCPPSSTTWTTYLPSGEMAASNALPVLVSLAIFILWKGTAAPGCFRLYRLTLALTESVQPQGNPGDAIRTAVNTMIAVPRRRLSSLRRY
jgi:hypothetical protein